MGLALPASVTTKPLKGTVNNLYVAFKGFDIEVHCVHNYAVACSLFLAHQKS